MVTELVTYRGELVTIRYPETILNSYYAQDTPSLEDSGIWISYCDYNGEVRCYYNALTKERTWV